MGTACVRKQKDPDHAPRYQNSKITMVLHEFDAAFSLDSPIENLEIIDKRKQIKQNYPFQQKLQNLVYIDDTKKWKRIKLPHKQKQKYWFFSQQQSQNLKGIGILYHVGRYGDYMVQGKFQNNTINEKQKYLKIFHNSDSYIGTLNHDFDPDGIGQLHYQNKDIYKGQFSIGLPHGKGQIKTKYKKFVGTFKKGQQQKGKLFQKNGTYEGGFKNNMKQGKGYYVQKNGDQYYGHFERDKKNGLGQLFNSQGKLLRKGHWKDDKYKK